MKILAISIFDDKAAVFNPPLFFANKALAMRWFGDRVAEQNSHIGKHPSDFHLYCLGEFDDLSGSFESFPKPDFLCHAVDFVNNNKEVSNG